MKRSVYVFVKLTPSDSENYVCALDFCFVLLKTSVRLCLVDKNKINAVF